MLYNDDVIQIIGLNIEEHEGDKWSEHYEVLYNCYKEEEPDLYELLYDIGLFCLNEKEDFLTDKEALVEYLTKPDTYFDKGDGSLFGDYCNIIGLLKDYEDFVIRKVD